MTFFRILAALVRRQWYLLRGGMLRGECAYTFYRGGRIETVAACKGSLPNPTITCTFYQK